MQGTASGAWSATGSPTVKAAQRDVDLAQVVEELRSRLHARDQEVIPGASACDVEQVALGVVGLLKVRVVANGLIREARGSGFLLVRSNHAVGNCGTSGGGSACTRDDRFLRSWYGAGRRSI